MISLGDPLKGRLGSINRDMVFSHCEALALGFVETDPLVVERQDEQYPLVVREENISGKVLWKVASSIDAFLRCLLIVAECIGQGLATESCDAWRASANEAKLKAIATAGGLEYAPFFEMLLGTD